MISSTSFVRFSLLAGLAASSLFACAADKTELDPAAIDAIDINEGKEDSLRFPTVKGTLGMGESTTGRVSHAHGYHAYDFSYDGAPGLVRLDAKSTAGRDLVLAAYRRVNNRWVMQDWNDDCGDGSLNSCLALPSTAGRYRFVVTTFEALTGTPTIANYSFAITCKDGGCLPRDCGGITGLQCGAGQYCSFPLEATCGAADQMGTCETMPEICTKEYAPVCGCDDQTYGNACMAAAAGISIGAPGECPPIACGARAGDTCGPWQYCQFSRTAICGQADAQGVCASRPDVCTADFAPVCGCDGVNYSNECAASAAGTGVLHDGNCQ